MLGLELSSGAWQMSTLGHGDLRDRVGQPVDSGYERELSLPRL